MAVTRPSILEILDSPSGRASIKAFVTSLETPSEGGADGLLDKSPAKTLDIPTSDKYAIGSASLDAFLQSNVTGPTLEHTPQLEHLFRTADEKSRTLSELRQICVEGLRVDGVSPYPYVPFIELFGLAKFIFTQTLGSSDEQAVFLPWSAEDESQVRVGLSWMRLRIQVWHYKILTQPNLGAGSSFTKASQWNDVPTLVACILDSIAASRSQVVDTEVWSEDAEWAREEKIQCLLEIVHSYIMLGRDEKARSALKEVTVMSNFSYVLSGALGKRTRFQEKSTSQLVVFAKSSTESQDVGQSAPNALPLNDDTVLEKIDFAESASANGDTARESTIPPALQDLSPENQPPLHPLDQIILLTEATLKDSFSPVDTLTSEEVLPYAQRVIDDKSKNWQIYTEALLVRSRIEMHRSRTVERGVLQMQALVDQIIVDTSAPEGPSDTAEVPNTSEESTVPIISVTAPESEGTAQEPVAEEKPTSFFPAAKPSESAPAHVRLQYVHALASPPRWHLESELAFSWAKVGSLVSALEIFKRLRLWAEVSLCFASAAAAEDEDGRGSGGEEKAIGLLRWRLFQRTGTEPTPSSNADSDPVSDVTRIKPADFSGPARTPAPPNAPRLLCILGDLENDPAHYTRAWEVSNKRFSRAQKSLGEFHLREQKDYPAARDAYKKAVAVNRLSPELWSRLGDIHLRLGEYEDAAEAYTRAIAAADDVVGGDDARTWSNLGSALWSLYRQTIETPDSQDAPNGENTPSTPKRDPETLLTQSLSAYKHGASLSRQNWQIWDNVLTLATRTHPPQTQTIIQAQTQILHIRKTESCLDADLLQTLLQQSLLSRPKPPSDSGTGQYVPPRGTTEKSIIDLFETEIVPVITSRSELWDLVARERVWKRDYEGALDASERGWRAATSTLPSSLGAQAVTKSWLSDEEAWRVVVDSTEALVTRLENYGPDVEGVGERWRAKARNALRSVMGRGREMWEGSEGWGVLEGLVEGIKK